MKLRLTDNTYMDTALRCASGQSSEEGLSWALINKTA